MSYVVKEFERLPKQLLHEYCQKQKLQKPYYVNSQSDTPGTYTDTAHFIFYSTKKKK